MMDKLSVVIVGDVSRQITRDCVESLGDCQTIIEPFDGNYNRSLNRGYKKAEHDYIAFCNNDLIFTPGWFDKLLPHFNEYDSLSPYCPLTHKKWWKNKLPSGIVEGFTIGKILAGWCFVMKRKTYIKIGSFDEDVDFWYSDDIYADQLKFHGLKHALVCDSYVMHKGSSTLTELPPAELKRLTFNQRYLYINAKQKYA